MQSRKRDCVVFFVRSVRRTLLNRTIKLQISKNILLTTKLVSANIYTVRNDLLKSEGRQVMPLTLANVGEETMIRKIGGKPEVRAHLENLGFVTGSTVTVVTTIGGNLIVNVKNSRVAISREMASKIMV